MQGTHIDTLGGQEGGCSIRRKREDDLVGNLPQMGKVSHKKNEGQHGRTN